MKRLHGFFTVSFLMLSLLAAGCSKEDSNPASSTAVTNPGPPPSVPNINIKGPSSMSDDPSLALVKGLFQGFNTFTYYSNKFQNVQAVYSDSTWVRKFVEGPITAVLTATQLSDGTFSWKLTLNGTNDTVTYNNWLALEGTSSADGRIGTWKLFRNNTNILTGDYSWQTNTDNSTTITVREYQADGNVRSKIEATENTDKSGQVLVYFLSNLSFKALWAADGTGQWWTYDSSGNIRHQGTWS